MFVEKAAREEVMRKSEDTGRKTVLNNKKTGAFFTPKKLSESICSYIFDETEIKNNLSIEVLEPSVGDGSFLHALSNISSAKKIFMNVDAIDIASEFINECKRENFSPVSINYIISDFFDFNPSEKKYDLIIGNPPYVSYKHLSKQKIEIIRSYFISKGIEVSGFRNLWTAFLLKSIDLLKINGVMSFVLPKELLHINHASWLRNLLSNNFEKIEIFLFDELHFQKTYQDIVVIICSKTNNEKGVFISENNDFLLTKENKQPLSSKETSNAQWPKFQLTQKEKNILTRVISKINSIDQYCKAVAGIVPAANSFFILPQEQVIENNLGNFVYPIIQRSSFIKNNINLTKEIWNNVVSEGLPCFLLAKYNYDAPEKEVQDYLDAPESQIIKLRYKMTKRNPWHRIPGIWSSEGIFFKRTSEMPKFILNKEHILVTDSGYRVTPFKGIKMRDLIYSFYNSITLIQMELNGRAYGGGVLELTPLEFKRLRIPHHKTTSREFQNFVKSFQNLSFSDALNQHDYKILPSLGLSGKEIETVQELRHRLYKKRQKK